MCLPIAGRSADPQAGGIMTEAATGIFRTVRRIASLLFFAVLAVSCGGGDDTAAPAHPPSISNLRYSPASAAPVPGGTVTISGTFDFSDVGGDISSVRITSSGGAEVTTPTPQLSGIASGTAVGQVAVSVDQPGKYTFELWVTDSTGLSSNKLIGTFEVTAAPTDHPPGITNLKYSPASAYQTASGTVLVAGSVDFADTGGDMVRLDVATSWGAAESFSTLEFKGVTSGTARFYIGVPTSQIGLQTFDVSVVDGQGKVSNRLAGAFDVYPVSPDAHIPAITNLSYAPVSTVQARDGTQAVAWRFDFRDSQGDIARIQITGAGGVNASIETPYLSGLVAGDTNGTFTISTTQAGKYPFEIWAVDGTGNLSNRLSGTFEVLPPDSWMRLAVRPPSTLNGIAWNGRYVAVGASGTVMASTDLTTWSAQSIGAEFALASVAASPARFVAVGSAAGSAVVTTSTDGGVWSVAHRLASPSKLTKVLWAGTQFVAVGCESLSDAKQYALFLTSPDGLAWTQRSTGFFELDPFPPGSCGMKSVAWSGSVFVASGIDASWSPAFWRSTDATSWAKEGDLPSEAVWTGHYDVAWGSGRFVAVGPDGSNGDAPTFTSIDGITWRQDTVADNLPPMDAVTSGPGSFVAVGPTHRQTSPDGLNWAPYPMPDCGNAVVSDGTRFVSVGAYICRSQ
jgi:hypothetical protein